MKCIEFTYYYLPYYVCNDIVINNRHTKLLLKLLAIIVKFTAILVKNVYLIRAFKLLIFLILLKCWMAEWRLPQRYDNKIHNNDIYITLEPFLNIAFYILYIFYTRKYHNFCKNRTRTFLLYYIIYRNTE